MIYHGCIDIVIFYCTLTYLYLERTYGVAALNANLPLSKVLLKYLKIKESINPTTETTPNQLLILETSMKNFNFNSKSNKCQSFFPLDSLVVRCFHWYQALVRSGCKLFKAMGTIAG